MALWSLPSHTPLNPRPIPFHLFYPMLAAYCWFGPSQYFYLLFFLPIYLSAILSPAGSIIYSYFLVCLILKKKLTLCFCDLPLASAICPGGSLTSKDVRPIIPKRGTPEAGKKRSQAPADDCCEYAVGKVMTCIGVIMVES